MMHRLLSRLLPSARANRRAVEAQLALLEHFTTAATNRRRVERSLALVEEFALAARGSMLAPAAA